MAKARSAKFTIGAVVKHRLFPFRGVVFDIDPEFANTEEWYNAIPAETPPRRDKPRPSRNPARKGPTVLPFVRRERRERIHRLRFGAEPASRRVRRAGAPP